MDSWVCVCVQTCSFSTACAQSLSSRQQDACSVRFSRGSISLCELESAVLDDSYNVSERASESILLC